ncbi:helix-hairpin-helix domain-containing protein [Paucibacter sp. O1-1]|nr:helix-hairpin-helix domain-containing protein [Paucibacter sp. O1-1]MDA3827768.1 helix-hairpin-helix domain-containing protein [Paucibacter sp. O1-1]
MMMRRRQLLGLIAALPVLAAAEPLPLELNSASQAELESLAGVGPALAERLLAARAQAPFKDWADLQRRVRGIGTALARKLSAQGLRVQGLAYDN